MRISSSAPGVVTVDDILKEVSKERSLQDAQWGGSQHDDAHRMADWPSFIAKQAASIRSMSAFSQENSEEFEERMIKVAALAFAAIQSNRRRLFKHYGIA